MKITPDERTAIEDAKDGTNDQREKKEMVTFGGIARNESGKLTKSNYFRFLNHKLDDYTDIEFTPKEAKKVHTHLLKLSTGASAMTPMYCGGSVCPFKERCVFWQMDKAPVGKQCHVSSDKIWTTQGEVLIADLDPEKHSLIGYDLKRNAIRRGREEDQIGFAFKKASRPYSGWVYNVGSKENRYNVTGNHICIAKWNEKALDKFCVYLMRKGKYWRVGKSRILGFSSGKYSLPFARRGTQEAADQLWVLGIYDTNTEALLAEEYFSIDFQCSRACFVESFQKIQEEQKRQDKHNGLYRWATTEQLVRHHEQFVKPLCFYAKKLDKLGLSIDYPIWDRDNNSRTKGEIKVYARWPMHIRACNMISEIMDVPMVPNNEVPTPVGNKKYWLAEFRPCEVTQSQYQGTVYSLDVERHQTYFAGNIAIHNCLTEVELMTTWVTDYMKEFDVDPNITTEVAYVNELAEIQILEMRINMNLAKAVNAELVTEQTIGVDRDGDPIIQKQISPFMELKEKLSNRRTKIIKLMVGDRQEKYKKEAALKMKPDDDPSSKMSTMRTKLEGLARQLNTMEKETRLTSGDAVPEILSPEDLIDTKE